MSIDILHGQIIKFYRIFQIMTKFVNELSLKLSLNTKEKIYISIS